jgi:predicted transcriptional regulator
MTPSLIHANMSRVTWSYNTTLNRLQELEAEGYVETHDEKNGWYRITDVGRSAVGG